MILIAQLAKGEGNIISAFLQRLHFEGSKRSRDMDKGWP